MRTPPCLALVALVLGGCAFTPVGSAPSTVRPPTPTAREIGPLEFIPSIRGRDGGYSALFRDRSVWVFGDTVLETAAVDGERWRSSTCGHTADLHHLSGFRDPVDANGAPPEFLPFSAEEAAFNRAHNRAELGEKRRRWALWPGPIAVHPETGRALVFYFKISAGHGAWNFECVGGSLATWEHPDHPPVRAAGLLFPRGDVQIGQGALVADDWIYAYGCVTKDLSWPCIVARVKFDHALRRDAWRFYAGEDRWVADAARAVEIMQAAPQLSVHWNDHLGSYVAFYGDPLRNSISMRASPAPEGPWSEPVAVHDGLPPVGEGQWNYCALAHAELQREGGRVEVLSYYRTTGFLRGEIRLVELRFR